MTSFDFSDPVQTSLPHIYRQGTLRGRGGMDEDEFAETEGALSPSSALSRSNLGSGPSASQYPLSIYSQPNASAISFSQYGVAPHHEPQLDHESFSAVRHDEAPPPYVELEARNAHTNVNIDEVTETPILPSDNLSLHYGVATSNATGTTTTTDLYATPPSEASTIPSIPTGTASLYASSTPASFPARLLPQQRGQVTTFPPPAAPPTKAQEAGYEPIEHAGYEQIQGLNNIRPQHNFVTPTDSTVSSLTPTMAVDSLDAPLFSRDSKRYFAYLIPYPSPKNDDIACPKPPERFLIYTPMPSFLQKPADRAKESAERRRQRHSSEDRRLLKEQKEKNTTGSAWQSFRAKTRLGFDDLSKRTTGSDVDFLARLPMPGGKEREDLSVSAEHSAAQSMEELIIVYPDSCQSSKEDIRKTFVGAMMKARSRAQRDAAIATSLLPFAAAADFGAGTMGAMLALDSVWAYKSIRSARTAKALTNRFSADDSTKQHLKITIKASPALEPARKYMEERCFRIDRTNYPYPGIVIPSEAEVLSAIHWKPSVVLDGSVSPQDVEWEIKEAHLDLEETMKKGAKEWTSWCKKFLQDPEKAFRLDAKEKQSLSLAK